MKKPTFTKDELAKILSYDYKEVNEPFWFKNVPEEEYHRRKLGSRVVKNESGQEWLEISIDGEFYRADQLAWYLTLGEWIETIGHKDGVLLNNSWDNLYDPLIDYPKTKVG